LKTLKEFKLLWRAVHKFTLRVFLHILRFFTTPGAHYQITGDSCSSTEVFNSLKGSIIHLRRRPRFNAVYHCLLRKFAHYSLLAASNINATNFIFPTVLLLFAWFDILYCCSVHKTFYLSAEHTRK